MPDLIRYPVFSLDSGLRRNDGNLKVVMPDLTLALACPSGYQGMRVLPERRKFSCFIAGVIMV
jgi:hypothetical protein